MIYILQIRFSLRIAGLQPSVLLDNGFMQCMTIFSKYNVPENFEIGISFVSTNPEETNNETAAGMSFYMQKVSKVTINMSTLYFGTGQWCIILKRILHVLLL